MANEFAQLCTDFNIIHLRSPPRHPQSNGLAERIVNILKRFFLYTMILLGAASTFAKGDKAESIFVHLQLYVEATSDHRSLAEMFFDHRFRIPLDIFTPTEKPKSTLSRQQIKMKKFDIHVGARTCRFIETADDSTFGRSSSFRRDSPLHRIHNCSCPC